MKQAVKQVEGEEKRQGWESAVWSALSLVCDIACSGLNSFMLALSALPKIYSNMGTIAGITHRVGQLLEALEELEV